VFQDESEGCPCRFPVCREFRAERGSSQTASTTTHPPQDQPSLAYVSLCRAFRGLWRLSQAPFAGFRFAIRGYVGRFSGMSLPAGFV